MLKKTAFCLFVLALLVGTGNSFAQPEGFTIASPDVKGVPLPEGTQLDLQNAADLTPGDLKALLEQSSCSNQTENLDACYACAGLNCAGPCWRIPCGFYINANQQTPPTPFFRSFVPGCAVTVVSTCKDLSATAPCQAWAFNYPGSKVCINYNGPTPPGLQSVGCANPPATDRE